MSWFAASVEEMKHFIDRFEHEDEITVKADDDIIAAIVGTIQGVLVMQQASVQQVGVMRTLEILEQSPPGR